MKDEKQTFEEYLVENLKRDDPYPVIDFSLRACFNMEGLVEFYIHPSSRDGNTPTFKVVGNLLVPKEF